MTYQPSTTRRLHTIVVPHAHRTQNSELIDRSDLRPLVMRPLVAIADRRCNPKDLEPDLAAMANGVEHGGVQESRHESLGVRGDGGRKRSGAFGRYRPGRDISKRR